MYEAKIIFYDFSPVITSSTSKAYDAAAKTYAAAVTRLPAGVRTAIQRDPIESLQVFAFLIICWLPPTVGPSY